MADNNVIFQQLVLPGIDTNCFFALKKGERDVVVIDPGDQAETIKKAAAEMGGEVKTILLTHGHFDHIGAVTELQKDCGATVYAMEAEKELLGDPMQNLSGLRGKGFSVVPDELLKDGQELSLCGLTWKVIATPGHTIGGACFYIPEMKLLFSGDTLFAGSVGRTDFPTGDMLEILRTVRSKLTELPDDTAVYPGHGPSTTMLHEKQTNPYLGD